MKSAEKMEKKSGQVSNLPKLFLFVIDAPAKILNAQLEALCSLLNQGEKAYQG
jgi:hypothetical protein